VSVPVLEWYAGAPRVDRAHLRVRWASCPFPAIADRVPRVGRVLELGCGHGLFSSYLAWSSPAREVTGTDVDADKIAVAQAASIRALRADANVTFRVDDARHMPPGPWDCVVVVDVLYILSEDDQRAVVEAAAARLEPGGVLVVKEMATGPRWKVRWNRGQETLAVKVLRFTEGGSFHDTSPELIARFMTGAGLEVTESTPLDRGYVHPHHVLVAQRVV
jgi:2-polyprenyl-3-methyl-5-hydroxy-6-metoxy-1,4-benzoquinol methylase